MAHKQPTADEVHSVSVALGARHYDYWPAKAFAGTLMLDGAPVTPDATAEAINRNKQGKPLVRHLTLGFLHLIFYDTVAVCTDRAKDGKPDPEGPIVELNVAVFPPKK